LTNSADLRNLTMRLYSISEAARNLGVDRNTLYKWIREKEIPTPKVQFVSGIRLRVWTETQMAELRAYKTSAYWGKGKSRNRKRRAQV
jgi:excisionase family DNA binding protein